MRASNSKRVSSAAPSEQRRTSRFFPFRGYRSSKRDVDAPDENIPSSGVQLESSGVNPYEAGDTSTGNNDTETALPAATGPYPPESSQSLSQVEAQECNPTQSSAQLEADGAPQHAPDARAVPIIVEPTLPNDTDTAPPSLTEAVNDAGVLSPTSADAAHFAVAQPSPPTASNVTAIQQGAALKARLDPGEVLVEVELARTETGFGVGLGDNFVVTELLAGGSGERAGINVGDQILMVGDTIIKQDDNLTSMLSSHHTVKLILRRSSYVSSSISGQADSASSAMTDSAVDSHPALESGAHTVVLDRHSLSDPPGMQLTSESPSSVADMASLQVLIPSRSDTIPSLT